MYMVDNSHLLYNQRRSSAETLTGRRNLESYFQDGEWCRIPVNLVGELKLESIAVGSRVLPDACLVLVEFLEKSVD